MPRSNRKRAGGWRRRRRSAICGALLSLGAPIRAGRPAARSGPRALNATAPIFERASREDEPIGETSFFSVSRRSVMPSLFLVAAPDFVEGLLQLVVGVIRVVGV